MANRRRKLGCPRRECDKEGEDESCSSGPWKGGGIGEFRLHDRAYPTRWRFFLKGNRVFGSGAVSFGSVLNETSKDCHSEAAGRRISRSVRELARFFTSALLRLRMTFPLLFFSN